MGGAALVCCCLLLGAARPWVGGPYGLQEDLEDYPISGSEQQFVHQEKFPQTLEQRGSMPLTPQSYGQECQAPVVLPSIGEHRGQYKA